MAIDMLCPINPTPRGERTGDAAYHQTDGALVTLTGLREGDTMPPFPNGPPQSKRHMGNFLNSGTAWL